MVTRCLLFCLVCFSLSLQVYGQHYRGGIAFYQHALIQKGDSLYIDFGIQAEGQCVAPDEYLTLTPVLKLGESEKRLPPVVLNGHKRQKLYNRMQVLDKNNESFYPAIVIDAGKQDSVTIPYKMAVAYEEWMKDASLFLEQMTCGCGLQQREISVEILAAGISPEQLTPQVATYDMKPQVNYITPVAEAAKQREEQLSVYLDFVVGESVILPLFGDNLSGLSRINMLVNRLKGDKNISITCMRVEGYASPEGMYELNSRLSQARAAALKTYLEGMYGFGGDMVKAEGKSEDWQGLEKLLEETNFPYRDKALGIIHTTGISGGREARLMALQGGFPYRQMKAELFPKLRRVVYTVSYTVAPFDMNEGKQALKTRPALLSLNELFLIANSYEKGSPGFREAFDIAARLYPDNPVAIINAAAAALESGELQTARKFLGKVKNNDKARNNLGVLYLLDGEYDKAGECFRIAQSLGIPQAEHNLKGLEKKAGKTQQ